LEYAFGLDPNSGASRQTPISQRIGDEFVVVFSTPPGVA
jgi:hypothetical protein